MMKKRFHYWSGIAATLLIFTCLGQPVTAQVDENREPLSLLFSWQVDSQTPKLSPTIAVRQHLKNGATRLVEDQEDISRLLMAQLEKEIKSLRVRRACDPVAAAKLMAAGKIDIARLVHLSSAVIEDQKVWKKLSTPLAVGPNFHLDVLEYHNKVKEITPPLFTNLNERARRPLFARDGFFGNDSLFGKIKRGLVLIEDSGINLH